MSTVEINGSLVSGLEEILTPEALAFLGELQRRFAPTRAALLERREATRRDPLRFDPETAHIRAGDWQVPPPPPGLVDRRVEITGPTERKMMINALNSGAKVWLADLEDANTPHWHNVIAGQVNLRDAVRGTAEFVNPDGRTYRLRTDAPLATIVVRPRGWHLDERHLTLDGIPLVGALVDAGLYLFHNARQLLDQGSGPYFYLAKTESHLEARLWNDVFAYAETALGVAAGSIRATVLIETIPAAFEMAEILYELREHAAGLNAGRWDYLFSIIKRFRDAGPDFVLPERAALTMTSPFLRSYTEQLVRTCHAHGAMAIGGMAAFIPARHDPDLTEHAFAKVREDKLREANDGFDGSWVAHPDLVPVAQAIFDEVLGERPNQLDRDRADVVADEQGLLDIPAGPITRDGVATNVRVGVQYLAAWLGGTGAVAIDNLMEDAATAEICRSQLWQWIHNGVRLTDSDVIVDAELVRKILVDVEVSGPCAEQAKTLFDEVTLSTDFAAFLTLPGYALID